MKLKLEYPMPFYVNKDPDVFRETTMFDISFDTKIHYFKNYDSGYSHLVLKVFGFGIRITVEES
jgi:hypothetical protein